MIATAVGGLNSLDKIIPAVKALGARHSGYGVTGAHYAIVGEALLWTLERGLGEGFTRRCVPLGLRCMACLPQPCRPVPRKSPSFARQNELGNICKKLRQNWLRRGW